MSATEKMQQRGSSVRVTGSRVRPRRDAGRAAMMAAAAQVVERLEDRTLMADFSALVNFQPAAAPVPAGYVADGGAVYGARGNGLTYGWDAHNAATTRDRNLSNSPGQQYDTLVHTQLNGARTWEIAVPAGSYRVRLVAGDPGYVNSAYKFDVEQSPILSGTPTLAQRWVEGGGVVDVQDGRLTITNAAGASNNKLAFVEITSTATATQPSINTISPSAGQTNVRRDAFVGADLYLPNGALDPATVTGDTVWLRRASDDVLIPATVNTSGGGDSIVLQPRDYLAANTQYTFTASAGVKDVSGASLVPFTMSFTTGAEGGPVQSEIEFQKVLLPSTNGKSWTALAMGPDRKLYAGSLDGFVVRWPVNADGTLGAAEEIASIRTANGGDRMLTGIVFDPSSTATNPKLWVTHGDFSFDVDAEAWSGKLTLLSGPALATTQDVLVGLPRAAHNHLTNQAVFGPDGAMYLSQGGNTAQARQGQHLGPARRDAAERAILRVDLTRITPGQPLDVRTVDGGGTYDPFAAGVPVTLYATGLQRLRPRLDARRQAVRHEQRLQRRRATPGTPAVRRPLHAAHRRAQNGPYTAAGAGHQPAQRGPARHALPRPARRLLRAPQRQPARVRPQRRQPDRRRRPRRDRQLPRRHAARPQTSAAAAWDFGVKHSVNGIIEYGSDAFGARKGKLLAVQYSGGDNVMVMTRGRRRRDRVGRGQYVGLTGFADPLDLVEDPASGFLYVAEHGGDDAAGQRITLLRPGEGRHRHAGPRRPARQPGRRRDARRLDDRRHRRRAYDVTGGGPDVTDFADGFRFAHQQRTGDFDIRTRVDSLTNVTATTKAGLMGAESLAADSRNVFASTTPAKSVRLSYRAATGADTTFVHGSAPTFPGWLRCAASATRSPHTPARTARRGRRSARSRWPCCRRSTSAWPSPRVPRRLPPRPPRSSAKCPTSAARPSRPTGRPARNCRWR